MKKKGEKMEGKYFLLEKLISAFSEIFSRENVD
jgi:hypothetical protein